MDEPSSLSRLSIHERLAGWKKDRDVKLGVVVVMTLLGGGGGSVAGALLGKLVGAAGGVPGVLLGIGSGTMIGGFVGTLAAYETGCAWVAHWCRDNG